MGNQHNIKLLLAGPGDNLPEETIRSILTAFHSEGLNPSFKLCDTSERVKRILSEVCDTSPVREVSVHEVPVTNVNMAFCFYDSDTPEFQRFALLCSEALLSVNRVVNPKQE